MSQACPSEEWASRSRRRRGLFTLTLLLAMGSGPVVQYAVAALAPFLVTDLGLTRAQLGGYTAALFIMAAASGPLLGRLVDTFGGRKILSLSFLFSTLALVLLAATTSYLWLLVVAVVAGIPMAAANPATNKIVQATMPPGRRGLVMGVKQSGVMVGVTFTNLAMPALALAFGWRSAVLTGVAVTLLGSVLVLQFVEPTEAGTATREDRNRSARSVLTPFVPWLAVYGGLMGAGQAAVSTYLPLYAFEGVGMGEASAGAVAGISGAAGIASRILWGVTAEKLSSPGRALMLIATLSAGAIGLLWAGSRTGATVLVAGAILFGLTAPVWNVVGMLSIFRYVDEASTGRATGLVYRGFAVGFILGPVTFGAAVDQIGAYDTSWLGTALTFLLAIAVAARLRRYRPSGGADEPAVV